MPSETHIHIQSAVWAFEQTPSINKRLESGIPTNTWNLRFESVKHSESHIPRLPEALGCVDGHRVQAPLCLGALPRGSRPDLLYGGEQSGEMCSDVGQQALHTRLVCKRVS